MNLGLTAASESTIFGWSAADWSALSALATMAAVTVAVVTAAVAVRQLTATGRAQRAELRPYVVVDFEPSPASRHLVEFVVRNLGRSAAYDVSFEWTPQPVQSEPISGYQFTQLRLFRSPIPMLAPGREMRLHFDSMPVRDGRPDLLDVFSLRARYTDTSTFGGHRFDETTPLDLTLLRGNPQAVVYGVHDLVGQFKRLVDTVSRSALLDGVIVTQTLDEHQAQQNSRREAFERMTSGIAPANARGQRRLKRR